MRTFLLIGSAFSLATICAFHLADAWLLFAIPGSGLRYGDVLFHEMGHSLSGWLFGMPNIPAIFTLFGPEGVSGMTFGWARFDGLALAIFLGLIGWAYICYRRRHILQAVVSFLLIALIAESAATRSEELVIAYMGHGGSILTGGYLLFRGLALPRKRVISALERWLNFVFGFYLVFNNLNFAWHLAHHAAFLYEYTQMALAGFGHNDFAKIASVMPGWTVQGVANFTVGFSFATLIAAALAAALYRLYHGTFTLEDFTWSEDA